MSSRYFITFGLCFVEWKSTRVNSIIHSCVRLLAILTVRLLIENNHISLKCNFKKNKQNIVQFVVLFAMIIYKKRTIENNK